MTLHLGRRGPGHQARTDVGVAGEPQAGFSPEAEALFARFTVEPDVARKGLLDDLIAALKDAGVWTLLEGFYVLAAHDAQAARQNWRADVYNLTPVNGPAFTTDRGYVGDGASAHLDTGFDITTESALWDADASMCLGGYLAENPVGSQPYLGRSGLGNLSMRTPDGAQWISRIMRASDTVRTTGLTTGTFAIRRTSPVDVATYVNGAEQTGAATAATPTAATLVGLRAGTGYSTGRLAAMFFGSGAITEAQHAAIHGALLAYLTALGAD
ncbi:MAG: hypothetical protein ACOY5Y_12720 [Pseudomonadota bacterium]